MKSDVILVLKRPAIDKIAYLPLATLLVQPRDLTCMKHSKKIKVSPDLRNHHLAPIKIIKTS